MFIIQHLMYMYVSLRGSRTLPDIKHSLISKDNQWRTHHIEGISQILLERSIDLVGAEAGGHEGVVSTVSVRREPGLDGGN